MLAYTPAQLRSFCRYKVRLRRPQHNDVIDCVTKRRGSRAGRRQRSIFTTEGNAVTSQVVSDGDPRSRDILLTQQPAAHVDQLFTSPSTGDHRKRWELPSLFLANVRSLTNKLDDFEAVVRLNHPDIVCLTETWLSDDVPSEAVSIDGYDFFRKDRNRQGGGLACYVRSGLPCTRLQSYEVSGLQTMWFMFRSVCMPRWLSHIVLAIVYRLSHDVSTHSYLY